MSGPALIDADALPGSGIRLEDVSSAASAIAKKATAIRADGAGLATTWAALPAAYSSTGSESIYAALDPVATSSDSLASGLERVSRALDDWVSTVQPVLRRLDHLRAQIGTLARDVSDFTPRVEGTGDPWVLGMPVQVDSWQSDPGLVDRNNALIGEAYLLGEKLRVAEEDLANAIRKASGLAAIAVTPAATSAPDGLQTPWGTATARQESCAEKTIGFPTHQAGGVVEGAWGLLSGLSVLGGGWDLRSWPPPAVAVASQLAHGDLVAAGQTSLAQLKETGGAWVGLAHLVTGLGGGLMYLAADPLESQQIADLKARGADTSALEGLQQWQRDSFTAYADTLGGFVGYQAPAEWWHATPSEWGAGFSDWADDPGGTAGKSEFNIATLFLPVKGGGALLDAIKGARGGATVLEHGAGAVDGAAIEGGAGGAVDDVARSGERLTDGTVDDVGARVSVLTRDAVDAGAATRDLTTTIDRGPLGADADALGRLDSAPTVIEPAPLAPHPDPVTPHPDPVAPHVDPVTPRPDPVAPHDDPVTPHDDPVTQHQGPAGDPVAPHTDPPADHPGEPVPAGPAADHPGEPAPAGPSPAPEQHGPSDPGQAGTDPAAPTDHSTVPDPAHPGGRAEPIHPVLGDADGGPGAWQEVGRFDSQKGMPFQIEQSGVLPAADGRMVEYVVQRTGGKPVEFDNHLWRGPVETFQDFKGDYSWIDAMKQDRAIELLRGFVAQARRQLDVVPAGGRLEWWFRDPQVAEYARAVFDSDAGTAGRVDVHVVGG